MENTVNTIKIITTVIQIINIRAVESGTNA